MAKSSKFSKSSNVVGKEAGAAIKKEGDGAEARETKHLTIRCQLFSQNRGAATVEIRDPS